jgi:sugar O-acyltransferase (sialic acid O-acetyltransferase NeuD family)
MRTLYIIGAGGHGKVSAYIADKMNLWGSIKFLDDNVKGSVLDYQIIDKVDIHKYVGNKSDFFVAIGDNTIRKKITDNLIQNKGILVNLIDVTATISSKTVIGTGTIIMPGVIINPSTIIGNGAIINSGAIIEHDCNLGDFVHISSNATLSGNVKIDCNVWIGANATIINNIYIASDIIIGAGAVVIKDITESGVYVGIPAKRIKD